MNLINDKTYLKKSEHRWGLEEANGEGETVL
jgi:hypothetical protein